MLQCLMTTNFKIKEFFLLQTKGYWIYSCLYVGYIYNFVRMEIIMKTDIEIAQEAVMLPIKEVASKLDITEDDLELYGKYKAKLSEEYLSKIKNNKKN